MKKEDLASIKDYAVILIAKVLQNVNHPEEALSTGQIAARIAGCSATSTVDLSQKTISARLNTLIRMQEDEILGPILFNTLGGKICVSQARGILQGRHNPSCNTCRIQKYYYLIPALSETQTFMLGTMIKSHPYFSVEEKEQILDGLNLYMDENNQTKTYRLSKIPLPGESEKLIYNIEVLYNAIRENRQVVFKYGTYDGIQGKTSKVIFRLRKDEQGNDYCYKVNPYALVWDKGYYYLVATKSGTTEIRHYRIDRMVAPDFANKRTKDGIEALYRDFNPCNEEDIKSLKELGKYFKDRKFDSKSYVRNHYGMRIFESEELITLSVKCTYWSLQMLVDAFGNDITVSELDGENLKNDLGTYKSDERQLQTTIKNVEYKTALSFCMSHVDYLTVISPEKLKDELKSWLENAIRAIDGPN